MRSLNNISCSLGSSLFVPKKQRSYPASRKPTSAPLQKKFLSGSNGVAFHACEAEPIFSRIGQVEHFSLKVHDPRVSTISMPSQTQNTRQRGGAGGAARRCEPRPLHLQPIALFVYLSAFSMPSWPAQSTLRFSKCRERAQYAAAHAAVVGSGAEQKTLNEMHTKQLDSLYENVQTTRRRAAHTFTDTCGVEVLLVHALLLLGQPVNLQRMRLHASALLG